MSQITFLLVLEFLPPPDHHHVLDFAVYCNVSCSYMRLACFVIGDSRDSKVCVACDKLILVFQILRNINVNAIMLDTNGTCNAVNL